MGARNNFKTRGKFKSIRLFFHFAPHLLLSLRPPIMEEQPEQVETPEEEVEEVTEDMDLDLIDKAEKAAERIETATQAMERQIRKLEKLKMESILGGKAQTNMKPPEESNADYAKKVMANEQETRP